MGKILILGKKSGFRDPSRGGFTSTPSPGGPGPVPGPSGTPGSPGALSGPPPGGALAGAWDPDPRIPGLGSPGVPREPRRALRDPLPSPWEGSEGLFYINPSRRGPAVPLGVPP